MTLNNRAADPETHPHSLRLGRVKSLKKPRGVSAAEAYAGIAHLDHDRRLTIQFSEAGLDPQSSLSIRDPDIASMAFLNQVQQHLLQLNSVAQDCRERWWARSKDSSI
jgi:hypothetical protein